MFQKKTKRLLLGRLDVDEVPLTEGQAYCPSWSEGVLVDVSSTTALSYDARGDSVGKVTEQQERERGGGPQSSPSYAIEGVDEASAHTFSSTRRLSEVPRLHKWSPMSLVQLSIVVVALAVAMVVTLVFTLRNKEKGGLEARDDHHYSGFKVGKVDRDASFATATAGPNALMNSGWGQYDMNGGDRQQQGEGSPYLSFHIADKHTQSPQGSSQAPLLSSTPDGVVWWNDDGFGRGRFPFSTVGPASKSREGGRLDDMSGLGEKKTSARLKGTVVAAPSSPDKEGDRNEYDRRERRLGRVDRKTYLKNVDLHMLQKN